MDVTPLIKSGQSIVQGYSESGFRISGQSYDSAVIVTPEQILEWDVPGFEALSLEAFAPLLDMKDRLDVVLLGTGATIAFLPRELKQELQAEGLHVEVMDSGAACRTYNVLLADGRRVAAALLKPE